MSSNSFDPPRDGTGLTPVTFNREGAETSSRLGVPRIGATAGEAWPASRQPMYGTFYGLHEPPFELTPNPKFLFLTARQREALSNLRYGLSTHKGFTLLIGEAGTGKTTLVRAALDGLSDTVSRYVLVCNPTLGRSEFYEYLAREFGLSEEARTSKTRFLADLQLEVESRYAAGGLTGLIVDEAQSMPNELLEEIRLLGNIETTTTKLLNIVLSGQPELAHRLNQPSLRQLKQRVALRCELRALSLEESAAYISGRLRIAGGKPAEIFTRESVIAIYQATGGIPRTINVLCDNALISGFAAQVRPITLEIVEEVCRDFELGRLEDNRSEQDVEAESPAVSGALAVRRQDAPAAPDTTSTRPRPMFKDFTAAPKRRFSFFS